MVYLRVAFIVLFVGLPAIVEAQPGTTAPSRGQVFPGGDVDNTPTGIPKIERYGLTIAAVDLGSLAGGIAHPGISLSGYVLGGPLVHLSMGDSTKAMASLGMRLALPIAGGFIGGNLQDCSDGDSLCGVAGVILGGLMGIGTALVVDWFVLAKKTVYVDEPMRPGIRLGSAHILPDLMISANGDTSLGVRGMF